jgi:hypothetical protein
MKSPLLPARSACRVAALAILLPLSLPADVLLLKDGKRVEGEVTEQGDAYEVRTKYGALTIRREEVARRVKDAPSLVAEIEMLRKSAAEMAAEGFAIEGDPAARNQKLEAAAALYEKAIALCGDARKAFPDADVGRVSTLLTAGLQKVRSGIAPDTLAPVAPPKAPAAPPADPPKTPVAAPAAPKAPAAPPPAKPAARLPVPAAPALAEAEKQIRSLFKDDYAKRAPADRVALARRLLQAGEETKDDDALRYVALREARDLAAAAGDLDTAMAAIGRLGKGFDVDVPEQEAAAFAAAARTVDPDEGEAVFAKGMTLADRLAQSDEYEAALKLMTPLEDLARRMRNAEHVKTVQGRARELRTQQADWNRVKPALEKLKETPDDAEACLAVGRYYATAGKWAEALPLLAKGSAPALKEAAAKELAKPADAAAQAEAGDLWAASAEKETGPLKTALQDRARDFYEKALPGLTGLSRARVEKKINGLIAAATPSGGGALNLLALVNPQKDTVAGAWKSDGRALTSDAGACSRVMLPYEVPDEYDYRVDLSRVSGSGSIAIILTKGGREFVLETAWPAGQTGFAYVDGLHIDANPTGTKVPFTNGRRYSYVVQVRNSGLRLLVDGRPFIAWKTDYKNVTPHTGWALPNKNCVGFGSYASPTTFHAAELVEVSGRGKRVR